MTSLNDARAMNKALNETLDVKAEVVERPPITIQEADPMRQWEAMLAQAQTLVRSGFLPKAINTAEKALAVMQTGKELGIGSMQSLRAIHIIDGKPTMSAELIAGLVLSRIPGAMLRVVETNEDRCLVHAARPGHEPTPFGFTIKDAERAGLLGKDNWRKYPRAMLRSRCITEAARAIFPDATMGLYDADELGAITNETGEIVALPTSHNPDSVQEQLRAAIKVGLPNTEERRQEAFSAAEVEVEAKRIKIFERAQEVLQPLVPGSPRYHWAMEELFRTRDWDVVRGFSLKKLDADTRGRITQIVEQAKDTPEEELAKISEQHPVEGGTLLAKGSAQVVKATLIASIRTHIEKIPEGPARLKAMENAWGKPDWAELETFSLKEIEELIAAGHVARIVKDALGAAK